jgi:hypothetical protein
MARLTNAFKENKQAMPKSPLSLINDPEHWRSRAEEARTIAHQMSDEQAKQSMLRIADAYEDLSRQAAQRSIASP